MTRWFRFYDDAINEPKLLKLSDALYRAWVGVLCIASKSDGTLPPTEDVALMLRMKPERTEAVLADLVKAGLLDENETGMSPHNWNTRQYKSDVSNERVARYRKRLGNGECNVTSNGTVTPSESEADTETDTEQPSAVVPNPADAEIPLAVDAWNSMASKAGLPVIQKLTSKRRAALAQRLRDSGGILGWQVAMDKIGASSRLRGERNGRRYPNWKCTFDFIIGDTNFAKLMEGNYDDTGSDESARSRENAAILEGLGLKPDQQRGADTEPQGGDGAGGFVGRATPALPRIAGNPGGGDPQTRRLGQGVQRPGERPENRSAGVQRGDGASAGGFAGRSVQGDTGNAPVGDEAPATERDSERGQRPDGGAPVAIGEARDCEVLPHGKPDTPATHGSGEIPRGRDHAELAKQPGYDRDRELDDSVAWARQRA